MDKIVKTKSSITKKLLSKKDALKVFKDKDESYKEEIINIKAEGSTPEAIAKEIIKKVTVLKI